MSAEPDLRSGPPAGVARSTIVDPGLRPGRLAGAARSIVALAVNGTLRQAGYVLGENPVTAFAFGLFTWFVLCALIGPAVVPYDPLASGS